MKRNKKLIQRKEKEDAIALMEYQDANGIRRKPFKPNFFSVKKIFVIKIVLLCMLPIFYFIYSPLLLPICALYAAMYFITRNTENNLNAGMRKDLRVKLPKIDSFIALLLVGFAVFNVVLDCATTSTKGSMFEGRSESQIRAMMEERGISTSKIDSMIEQMETSGAFLSKSEKYALQAFTLNTGHRVMFKTKNEMAVRGISFRFLRRPSIVSTTNVGSGSERPPVNIEKPPDLSSIPFDRVFGQIVNALTFILIILLGVLGIIISVKTKKFLNIKQTKKRKS